LSAAWRDAYQQRELRGAALYLLGELLRVA
jgi:hypothetical protein